MFELFFYTHHLYILFMLFYVFHLGFAYFYTIPGFYLFAIDRFLRFLQSRQTVRLVSARVLPCQTLELNFSKSEALSYTPTSIVFINVPSISKLQWHPFTISSNSSLEPNRLSVMIKNEGQWTKKLYQMLSSPSASADRLNVSVEGPYGPHSTQFHRWTKKLYQMLSSPSASADRLNVSVEGPYGPHSTQFHRHQMLVTVSGGSGIAPFISIIRELIFTSTNLKTNTPKILLISAFEYSSDLSMLHLLDPPITSTTPSYDLSSLELQVDAYITRETERPPSENPKMLRTIWFKPNSLDSPISPTLGPSGWLWVGSIISSSFVIFLIFMGILTHCPLNQETNNRRDRKTIQVQNTLEGPTPEEASDDWELESPPSESLSKSTKLHYGGRPELKSKSFDGTQGIKCWSSCLWPRENET